MPDLDPTVAALRAECGLDEDEIERRKAFLELTPDDIAILREIHEPLLRRRPRFTLAFYDHLREVPELRRWLGDEETLTRLRASQARYFEQLTAGEYGEDYVYSRLRVGAVHQQIGLAPKWYLGAYRKYLDELIGPLWQICEGDFERFRRAYDALLKVVMLDMGLALETYFAADSRRIRELKAYAEQIIQCMPSGLAVLGEDRRFRFLNPAFRRLFALQPDEMPESLDALLPVEAVRERVDKAFANGVHQHFVPFELELHGERRHFELDISTTRLHGERELLLILQDVTERRRLGETVRLLGRALECAANGVVIADAREPDMPVTYVNPAFERMTGYRAAEIVGRNCRLLQGDDRDQPEIAELRTALAAHRPAHVILRNYRKDGSLFWNEVMIAPVTDEHGEVTHFVGIQNDISERKGFEQRLAHLATHDVLTDLPNRGLLHDRFERAVAQADRSGRLLALLFLDLDRFKKVNDSLGHTEGDRLLLTVAARLAQCVRQGDTVARLGGDEFVILLTDLHDSSEAGAVCRKIIETVAQPVMLGDTEVCMTCSVGVAFYGNDGQDFDTLLRNADAAMYRAKESGENQCRFYAQQMNERALGRLLLESELRHAVERNQLVLHYQPKLDLRNGRIVGLEALVRWVHPDRGMVSPGDFIPLAEETGLIVGIGEWVLQQATAQVRKWRERLDLDLHVAVNLSPRQFRNEDVVSMVRDTLTLTGLPATALELEITETSIMHDADAAVRKLEALKALGVRLAIDDFGTGYSSLGYLKRFPLDVLKIDRSFVDEVTVDPNDAAIARSIIALAHSLELKVVAEGIETEAQLAFLTTARCDEMQGFYFSRPLPAGEIETLLREDRRLEVYGRPLDEGRGLVFLGRDPGVLEQLEAAAAEQGGGLLVTTDPVEALDYMAAEPVAVVVAEQGIAGFDAMGFLRKVREIHPDTLRILLADAYDMNAIADAVSRRELFGVLLRPLREEAALTLLREAFRRHELEADHARTIAELKATNEKLLETNQRLLSGLGR